jgi:hypothetical protein
MPRHAPRRVRGRAAPTSQARWLPSRSQARRLVLASSSRRPSRRGAQLAELPMTGREPKPVSRLGADTCKYRHDLLPCRAIAYLIGDNIFLSTRVLCSSKDLRPSNAGLSSPGLAENSRWYILFSSYPFSVSFILAVWRCCPLPRVLALASLFGWPVRVLNVWSLQWAIFLQYPASTLTFPYSL